MGSLGTIRTMLSAHTKLRSAPSVKLTTVSTQVRDFSAALRATATRLKSELKAKEPESKVSKSQSESITLTSPANSPSTSGIGSQAPNKQQHRHFSLGNSSKPQKQPASAVKAPTQSRPTTLHVSKKLGDTVQLPLLKQESSTRVREIWLTERPNRPRIINGVVAEPEWKQLETNLKLAPMFIAPVKPDEMENVSGCGAYYNMIMQWNSNGTGANSEIVYSYLGDYQKNPQNAAPFMVVCLFEELLTSHKLVLLRADIVTDKLTRLQGERLVKYTREMYTDPGKFEWVKKFDVRPGEFDMEGMVREYGMYF